MKQTRILIALPLLVALFGCVRTPDVQADAMTRVQAQAAFEAGNYRRAKALIAQANRYRVPKAELWRRTLDLRIALAEGTQQGEFRHLLEAWAAQRSDWSAEDKADAELTLAETLRAPYAADWLYDMDSTLWPPMLRTRYNLLLTRLQAGTPTLYDDTVARWRLGIRGLYDSGNLAAAAHEADRCAADTRNAEAALIAAKLYNELGDEAKKKASLEQALTFSSDETVRREVGLIRTAPTGTKSAF